MTNRLYFCNLKYCPGLKFISGCGLRLIKVFSTLNAFLSPITDPFKCINMSMLDIYIYLTLGAQCLCLTLFSDPVRARAMYCIGCSLLTPRVLYLNIIALKIMNKYWQVLNRIHYTLLTHIKLYWKESSQSLSNMFTIEITIWRMLGLYVQIHYVKNFSRFEVRHEKKNHIF